MDFRLTGPIHSLPFVCRLYSFQASAAKSEERIVNVGPSSRRGLILK